MKVARLIELLQQCDPDDEVLTYDADAEADVPVTGVVHGDGSGKVILQTDDPS